MDNRTCYAARAAIGTPAGSALVQRDWHATTRRQYVVNLDAPHKVTASDGETRTIGTGEIYLVEDMHSKGHRSQALGVPRRSLMIPVD
jgi:hypothetical protein